MMHLTNLVSVVFTNTPTHMLTASRACDEAGPDADEGVRHAIAGDQ